MVYSHCIESLVSKLIYYISIDINHEEFYIFFGHQLSYDCCIESTEKRYHSVSYFIHYFSIFYCTPRLSRALFSRERERQHKQ